MSTRSDVRGNVFDVSRAQFRDLINSALSDHSSQAFKELYDFNLGIFDVSDADNDGLVSLRGFDTLVELAAHIPRKFGYAPMSEDIFPTAAAKTKAREALFNQIRSASPSGQSTAGMLTFDAWFSWVVKHVGEKATQRGGFWSSRSSSLMGGDAAEFLSFLVAATGSSKSPEYLDLYHHVRTVFTAVDRDYDGRINPEEFSELVELAAAAPREFGLAPKTSEMFKTPAEAKASRAKLFKEIDSKGRFGASGFITFGKLLRWLVPHIKGKLAEVKQPGNKFNKYLTKYEGQRLEALTKPQLKSFLYAATTEAGSAEARALRKWLTDLFLAVDFDNDGLIHSKAYFDILIENASYLPRKHGYAPMTIDIYPTEASRVAGRAALFAEISGGGDSISHHQWLQWSLAHIRGKVPRMGTPRALMDAADKYDFLAFLKAATGNPHSTEAMEFYYWLANCFCEADTVGDGNVRLTEFGGLVDRAASGATLLMANRGDGSAGGSVREAGVVIPLWGSVREAGVLIPLGGCV